MTANKRALLQICRITNTNEEIYRALGIDPMQDVNTVSIAQQQVLYPELGTLEGRVSKFYLEELFSGSGPDLEETAYWFHTPAEGWKKELTRYEKAEEAEVTFADPSHVSWERDGRVSLSELQEGQVITGTISDVWLYHGCQIDFGYEFDGLIPMTEDNWMQDEAVGMTLMPGDEVTCRVYKVRQPGLYRWPVQLQILEPASMVSHVMNPEDFNAPINHAWCHEQGWGMEEILKATGRKHYENSSYLIPTDPAEMTDDLQMAYGYDVEFENSLDVVDERVAMFSSPKWQKITQIANDYQSQQ